MAEATIGKTPENGQTEVRITYRFGPPPSASDADYPSEGSVFGDHHKNGRASGTPNIDVPTLTVVAVK